MRCARPTVLNPSRSGPTGRCSPPPLALLANRAASRAFGPGSSPSAVTGQTESDQINWVYCYLSESSKALWSPTSRSHAFGGGFPRGALVVQDDVKLTIVGEVDGARVKNLVPR